MKNKLRKPYKIIKQISDNFSKSIILIKKYLQEIKKTGLKS